MKKLFAGFVSGFLFLVVALPYSFAQQGSCSCGPEGFQREGKFMMSNTWHDGRGMMMRDHHMWKLLAGLGLDEKQKEAIKEVRSRVAKDIVKKRADLEVARIDSRDILAKDQVDMAAVETNVKKMASLQADIRLAHIKAMQEIKAKLTPEQQKKFQEMREMGPRAGKMAHYRIGMAMADQNE